jgi:uncharacterized FlgJ-related protein
MAMTMMIFRRSSKGTKHPSPLFLEAARLQQEPLSKKIKPKFFKNGFLKIYSIHPYVKKDDKAMLAEKTGLTKKQITGWFTNNRKRKYQKVADAAKKKGKDISKCHLLYFKL